MPNATRIAVVGFGLIGRRHAEVLRRSPDLVLAGVADPSEKSRREAVNLGTDAFSNLEDMLDATKPDGVIVATPTPMHLEQALACFARGCPLLIEKPIAVTAAEARHLTDAAEKASTPLLVGHHRRHNGMVKAAKVALDNGMIGDVRAVQATCWFYKPDHYFEIAPWRTKKGAGPISINLVHDVDLLRHFCGDVKSVRAVSVPSARGFENEDLATAILTFQNQAVATISVSDSIVSPWSWELTARENPAYPATNESCYLIGGSEGGLSLPDLRIWRHTPSPDWWMPMSSTSMICDTQDPLLTQLEHFANVIHGLEAPLVSGVEGLRSLEVVEAIGTSAESGIEVVIEPDVEANSCPREITAEV
ncbi:Gfo/Idh/MocA family protein [Ruegeria sp. HKCCD8929]|uniref:Gfo/Idh/MocA family protein n=1 Tax=Ruegeria sp. HKCCD8929 TaxID=2683006 RepID=UPI001487E061|nr:Gfo/Idh/MocA family oxidoreductase [Ruegeria sp. HKCCD8929]